MLAIVIFNNSSQSQSSSIEIDFINSVLLKQPGFTRLILCNRLDSFNLKEISTHLKKRKIEGFDVTTRKKTALRLSKQEKYTLTTALNELQTNEWKQSQFPDATLISIDSMLTCLLSRTRTNIAIYKLMLQYFKCYCTVIKPTQVLNSQHIFQFSKPIFIRNNEMVFFFFQRVCGGECGEQSFMVFRKSGSVYKKWLEIFGGVF